MYKIALLAPIFFLLCSCSKKQSPVVDTAFADSLVSHYADSKTSIATDSNLAFWERRMMIRPDNFVNGPKYAAALLSAFRIHGDIKDLRKADSLFVKSNEANQGKEPGICRTLASLAILQHQFPRADSFLKKAIAIEGNSLPNAFLDFDISFERGQYRHCENLLPALKNYNPYGYLFRRSKFEHYNGSLDSAISCMLQAAEEAGSNMYLKQTALSNAADLYMHQGKPVKAYRLYIQSIKIDPADLHSITGIGWIALSHDQDDSLAARIFRFVQSKTIAPDILLKMALLSEAGNDSPAQKEWADKFANTTDQPVYGLMYSKYLIDLYTGILNDPLKALRLAEKEIINRPTPQTYAWYTWALFCNHEKEKAWSIFRNAVSGKPLEGPELFYMGKLMEGMHKGYNAQQFFKAAYKNRYDLSSSKVDYIKKNSE